MTDTTAPVDGIKTVDSEQSQKNGELEKDENEVDKCCISTCPPKCCVSVKRRLLIINCFWQFFYGVERSVILPSLWLYLLTKFGQSSADGYYGIILAAFNISVFIFSPVFGFISAYYKISVKTLLIISNFLEILGNFLYFIGLQPWVILIGRFIAGIGGGCEVPLYADIIRSTKVSERTSVIVLLLATRHAGLIIGPSFTLLVDKAHFQVGDMSFDVYNFPGLLMCALWILHTIFAFPFYPTISRIPDERDKEAEKTVKRVSLVAFDFIPEVNPESDKSKHEDDEHKSILPKNNQTDSKSGRVSNFFGELKLNFKHYFTIQILTILVTAFGLYISVMGLEAVLPPVAQRNFNWSEVQISYIYLGCGFFIIIGYLILQVVSKHVSDRTLLGLGIATLIITYAGLTTILIFTTPTSNVAIFASIIISLVVIHVVGVQFCIASTEALFSKICLVTDVEQAQSIFRTVVNASFLIGPYLGGSLQGYAWVVMFIMTLLMVFSACFYAAAYKKLKVDPEPETKE